MKKTILLLMAVMLVMTLSLTSYAADPSIIGIWSMPILKGKDKGKERFNVEIFQKDGIYYGKIVKLSTGPANALCRTCKDDKKDKPLLGMLLLRNLKKEGSQYVEGKIYEVEEGKEYKCSMLLAGPDRLKVTACVLFLCESHYWTRAK
jgi:uncharacterized protein (DUF2147 family)